MSRLYTLARPVFRAGAMVALSLAVVACAKIGPEQTVEAFYKSNEAGDRDKVLSYLDPATVAMWGPDKLGAIMEVDRQRYVKCGGIKTVTADLKGADNRREGVVTVTFKGDCKPMKSPVRLLNKDGAWRFVI